jgi:predicted type IV restriction endonuclease
MQKQLDTIINSLRRGLFINEASVSQGVVLPLLNALGWSVFDPLSVAPEYTVGGGRVDYALLDTTSRPRIFIEVKRTGHLEGGDIQLFEYAFKEGVPMAILTNGQEWSFYLPAAQGSFEDRRIYKLDLLERTPIESEQRLRRYLEHDKVLSDKSLSDAQSDYTDATRGKLIKVTFPVAWDRLLRDKDELLIELLSEKVEDICGYRPSEDDCADFINKLSSHNSEIITSPNEKFVYNEDSKRSTPLIGPSYWIDGHTVQVHSAKELLQRLITALSDRDITFLERFAARRHGRSRRYISRNRYDLYPGRRDLCENYSVEIKPGWWLSTNYSRGNIQKILNLACEVAGLQINQNVKFSVG